MQRAVCTFETFDGRDRATIGRGYRRDTGTDRDAVQMDRTGAALRDAAAELRSGQTQLLANHPEQRRCRVDVHLARLAIDGELHHSITPLTNDAADGTATRTADDSRMSANAGPQKSV